MDKVASKAETESWNGVNHHNYITIKGTLLFLPHLLIEALSQYDT